METVKTIADIARIAGVSKSTVSRALNDNPAISKATRKRIQSIAAEYQFETHQGARCLSLNKSQTIALVYPESEHHRHMVTDPFFVEVLKGITSSVGEHGYDLIISQPRRDVFTDMYRFIESKRAAGVIYLGCCQGNAVEDWGNREVAIITCGSDPYENICSVDCDNIDGGRKAAKHLLQCGCDHFAFIGGPTERLETKLRLRGFKEILENEGDYLKQVHTMFGDYQSRSGYELMKQLLTESPRINGVFACSDLMAMGALEAIREEGRIAGKDISVIGFDDIPFAQFSSPPLTTIRQNIFKIGEVLVHKLMQFMVDGVISKSILPVELVIRKSTI
ncbi:LacI family transcriptional regulator [bacterium]|nr:LacI family transcriptional regulator [bacterium]